ncbi:PREDICTED: E3 ubiquitin-protein ligase RNF144A-like [Camelina sativa]|uniref:RBR-type E3 ubiquitin transferase n=1 Tax=Camelina sativa TaxID=90675 RepID=A0ABM1RKW8_CAMSA|nr:PREDICTED: E3 ubiquitin-protein ligase RNF144A-like [Camelina sativa]
MQPIRKRFASFFLNSPRKTTCNICLDDDINANQMFCVNKCRHRFCYVCMKKHIEVRLLFKGSVIRCPHYRCKSKLTFGSCVDLLTPELKKMWRQNIKEDSIPVKQRIYCPNPRCSALMSLKDLSKSTKEAGVWKYFFNSTEEARVRRRCFESGQLFCINCKVPWHSDLSCDECMRLSPNPTADDIKFEALANRNMWRQCGNCKHMIELAKGCIKVTCRCGHKFCYKCGAKAGDCCHGRLHTYISVQPWSPLHQRSPQPPLQPLLPPPSVYFTILFFAS